MDAGYTIDNSGVKSEFVFEHNFKFFQLIIRPSSQVLLCDYELKGEVSFVTYTPRANYTTKQNPQICNPPLYIAAT